MFKVREVGTGTLRVIQRERYLVRGGQEALEGVDEALDVHGAGQVRRAVAAEHLALGPVEQRARLLGDHDQLLRLLAVGHAAPPPVSIPLERKTRYIVPPSKGFRLAKC